MGLIYTIRRSPPISFNSYFVIIAMKKPILVENERL